MNSVLSSIQWLIKSFYSNEDNGVVQVTDDVGSLYKKWDLENVGRGATGEAYTMYKVDQPKPRTLVVGKIVLIGGYMVKAELTQEEAIESLEREASMLAKGSQGSDYIVQFICALRTPTKFYLITELCQPGNLGMALSFRRRLLCEVEVQSVVFCVLSALVHLNSLHMYHGDVKLDNLLLDQRGVVKICDFGNARAIEGERSDIESVGTFPYVPPELVDVYCNQDASGYFSNKIDVWSLGIVVIELFDLNTSFSDDSVDLLVEKIKACDFTFKDLNSVPEHAVAFVEQCLSRHHKDRPSPSQLTVGKFMQSMNHAASTHSIKSLIKEFSLPTYEIDRE